MHAPGELFVWIDEYHTSQKCPGCALQVTKQLHSRQEAAAAPEINNRFCQCQPQPRSTVQVSGAPSKEQWYEVSHPFVIVELWLTLFPVCCWCF